MVRWPWQRAPEEHPELAAEVALRFAFERPVDLAALRRATRAGLKAAARALRGKGRVRATADLAEGREARVHLTLRGPDATPERAGPVADAFARAFRTSYRGAFATREVPRRVEAPPPDGAGEDVSTK